jgi:hypothetical protein
MDDLKGIWTKQLEKSITAEAERSNNWSLLWKGEAIYESLNSRYINAWRKALRFMSRASLRATVDYICLRNAQVQPTPEAAARLFGVDDIDLALVKRAYTVVSRRECPAFLEDVGLGTTRPLVVPIPDPENRKQVVGLLGLWGLRKDARAAVESMFQQLSRTTKCEGRLPLALQRPPVAGFNAYSSRLVEWLVWPFLSPTGVFPSHPMVMLFGPAGAGKTTIAQLAAFDIATSLQWADVKRTGQNPQAAVAALPGNDVPLTDLNGYVTTYYVDTLQLRSGNGEQVARRLRNYLNCLQFEVSRDSARGKRRKMGLLILDNFDALFVSDAELRAQPRAERRASQLKSWIYRAAPEVVAKVAGKQPIPADLRAALSRADVTAADSDGTIKAGGGATNAKAGGDGGVQRVVVVSGSSQASVSGPSVAEAVGAVLRPEALRAEYPDVRVILSVRHPWKLPREYAEWARRRMYIDLPNAGIRRSHLEGLMRDDLYKNVADRIVEERNLRRRLANLIVPVGGDPESLDARRKAQIDQLLTGDDKQRDSAEPDQALYSKETAFRLAVGPLFLQEFERYNGLPVAPTAGNTLYALVQSVPAFKALADAYIAEAAGTLNSLSSGTGWTLEAYCRLQSESGLSHTEVDAYLTTVRKKDDGLAGTALYGYTLEDLTGMYQYLKTLVNDRLLRKGAKLKMAFVYGSERLTSEGCKETASDISRLVSDSGSITQGRTSLANWQPSSSETATCQVALGPDLSDVKTGISILPLWSRYGSHRVLRIEDAIRALTNYESRVTPKPDYPEFVVFQLYGTPTLGRGLLRPNDISHQCRARPGPVSTYLTQTPNAAILAPPAAAAVIAPYIAPQVVAYARPPPPQVFQFQPQFQPQFQQPQQQQQQAAASFAFQQQFQRPDAFLLAPRPGTFQLTAPQQQIGFQWGTVPWRAAGLFSPTPRLAGAAAEANSIANNDGESDGAWTWSAPTAGAAAKKQRASKRLDVPPGYLAFDSLFRRQPAQR